MSYQNPIEVYQTEMQSQIEGEIYKAVMKIGVYVDKDELLRALKYDRDQYQKGYTDHDSEIVRCKDCKHRFNGEHHDNCCDVLMEKVKWTFEVTVEPDWFCADGEGQ